ncbi:hypothetical protein [Niveispirillum fermenti]|uniref:hypothetical protein n=1 Tax=Niveispirillum fermenti TaxID=1233113 RepID=UPI003A89DD15
MMDRLFDALPLWFGILGGGVVALQVMTNVRQRLRRAERQHQGHQGRVHNASQAVREHARATLALKREQRQMEVELAELEQIIEECEQQAEREKVADTQIYVFDERKNIGDTAFVSMITHPDFNNLARNAPDEVVQSWKAGRRYLIWAASDKMAHAKVSMRFNQDKGYRVGQPAPYEGNQDNF